ncbi:MAG: hypothetical protein EHM87_23595 [Burkholderiales bacterium]|nr:MAG: hypothetical protein EHM87_23595 [Burkholderiales bacterium]
MRKFLNVFPEKSPPEGGLPDTDRPGNKDQDELDSPSGDNQKDPDESKKNSDNKKNQNHEGKQSAADFSNAPEIIHEHPELKPGSLCPFCSGKLYYHKTGDHFRTRIWFEAGPLLTATRHVFEDLRCNLCKEVIHVPPSAELIADGFEKEERFGYRAIAMLVIMKYFYAFPLYRMEKLQSHFSIHLPDATQWDQIVKFTERSRCLFNALIYYLAQLSHFLGDDTFNAIREKDCDLIVGRTTGKISFRNGCHSSVVIGRDSQGHYILAVKTDIIYLGEWLDEILQHRGKNLVTPFLMVDGSNQNLVTKTPVIMLNCNQHARKMFEDCKKHFPEQCGEVLAIYKKIFKIDRKTKEMTPAERLAYHQKHSLSLFDKLQEKIAAWVEAKLSPENSPFGQACDYFLKREEALRGFLKFEGAELSNNLTESQIITIALLRNVCEAFQTVYSAEVASNIFSIGLTATLNNVDLLDYFSAILRYHDVLEKSPEKFFPWEYKNTIASILAQPVPTG